MDNRNNKNLFAKDREAYRKPQSVRLSAYALDNRNTCKKDFDWVAPAPSPQPMPPVMTAQASLGIHPPSPQQVLVAHKLA